MKSPRGVVRRVLALAGAVLCGTVIAVAIPAAAQAHTAWITYSSECDETGSTRIITWNIENSEWNRTGEITAVLTTPATSLTGIVVGATMPKRTSPSTYLTGYHTVPGSTTSATFKFKAKWTDNYKTNNYISTTIPLDACKVHESKPAATFSPQCNGSVIATLSNEGDLPATLVITGKSPYTESKLIGPGGTENVTIPEESVDPAMTVKYGNTVLADTPDFNKLVCSPPTTVTNTTCTSISVVVTNPEDGRKITVTLTPTGSAGGARFGRSVVLAPDPVTFTLSPGSSKTTEFPAAAGSGVLIQITGLPDATLLWTQAEVCRAAPTQTPTETRTPTPTPTDPELPTTGASLTLPISIGGAFVAIGAAIMFVVRRRRGAHARF